MFFAEKFSQSQCSICPVGSHCHNTRSRRCEGSTRICSFQRQFEIRNFQRQVQICNFQRWVQICNFQRWFKIRNFQKWPFKDKQGEHTYFFSAASSFFFLLFAFVLFGYLFFVLFGTDGFGSGCPSASLVFWHYCWYFGGASGCSGHWHWSFFADAATLAFSLVGFLHCCSSSSLVLSEELDIGVEAAALALWVSLCKDLMIAVILIVILKALETFLWGQEPPFWRWRCPLAWGPALGMSWLQFSSQVFHCCYCLLGPDLVNSLLSTSQTDFRLGLFLLLFFMESRM